MNGVRGLKKFAQWVVWLLAFLVIAVALLISLGREVVDDISHYRIEINQYISSVLGLQFESEELRGEWHQLTPQAMAFGIALYAPDQSDPVVTLDSASLRLNLVQSILSRQLVWSQLQLGEIKLKVKEDADGGWAIGGLSLSGGGDDRALLDMLFNSTYLDIKKVSVTFQFFSGVETELKGRDIRLENDADFHRLLASVNLGGDNHSAVLIVEGWGDYHRLDKFDMLAYLKLNRIDFDGSLNDIANRWFPKIVARLGNIETDIDGEAWFKMKKGRVDMVGRASAAEIPLNWLNDALPITNFKTELTGWFDLGVDWGLSLQDVDFVWGERRIEPLTINLSQKVGSQSGSSSLAISQMNLGLLAEMLNKTKFAPEQALDVIKQLQPTGTVRNVHLDLRLNKDKPADVQVTANLDDVAIASWQGAPASRQINGYVEVNNMSGFIELDSLNGFAMKYPQVFDQYMEHSTMKGQIAWRVDKTTKSIKVTSGLMEMEGEEGAGRMSLYLDLPIGQSDQNPIMYLSVGVRNTHSKYRDRYIPNIPGILDQGLLTWLDQSLGDIVIPEVGFIWRGSLEEGDGGLRSIQLYLRAINGELKFQPDWPALKNLDALVTLDTGDLDVDVMAGTLGGAKLKQAKILTREGRAEDHYNLLIQGDVQSGLNDAIDVLARSPVESRIKGVLGWDLSGDTEIKLDLVIPLSKDAGEDSINIDTVIHNGTMSLPDSDIAFKKMNGILKYDDDKGLYSDKITGNFWGEPVTARLETEGSDILINVDGRFSMPALGRFLQLPSDQVLLGKTTVQAKMFIPSDRPIQSIRLQLNSQLKGATINIPAPFNKEADSERAFEAEVIFAEMLDLKLMLGDNIHSHLVLEDAEIQRGYLSINSEQATLPVVGQLLAVGHLDYFSLSEWQETYLNLLPAENQQYLSTNVVNNSISSPVNTQNSLSITPIFDFNISTLEVAGIEFEQADINGGFEDGRWVIGIQGDHTKGYVVIPQDNISPMLIELERLALPTPTEAGSDAMELSPFTLPHMQLDINSFSVGGKQFGEVSVLVEPQVDGVRLSNINANLLGLQLGSDDHNTSLTWTVKNNQHETKFEGILGADNLGEVMEAWKLPAILDSNKARFILSLDWEDRPWEISPESIKGEVSLHLVDGHFYQSPSVATNALIRLVGLFNFDNWIRRLKLDFSDLFSKGMSYNEMQGGLMFDQGELTFDPPLTVSFPSGRIKMEGVANIISEQIDARLATTLPVGTNLPWVVALAGGLPAGIGMYITSKLFKKQVDKFSSISYSVKGAWADPDIKIQKIFSNKISSSKSTDKTTDETPTIIEVPEEVPQ